MVKAFDYRTVKRQYILKEIILCFLRKKKQTKKKTQKKNKKKKKQKKKKNKKKQQKNKKKTKTKKKKKKQQKKNKNKKKTKKNKKNNNNNKTKKKNKKKKKKKEQNVIHCSFDYHYKTHAFEHFSCTDFMSCIFQNYRNVTDNVCLYMPSSVGNFTQENISYLLVFSDHWSHLRSYA